jgi:hypothetical protein
MLAGLAGLGGAAAPMAGLWAQYEWLTIPLSVALVGYANYKTFLKEKAPRRTRIAVGILTAITVLAWGHIFLHR